MTLETIAAIATASGEAGVGIVRLSGPRAIAIAAGMLGVAEAALDRRVRVGIARDGAGQRLDEVLAFAMRAPASFTGEDVAELQGHGGRHNLEQLLAAAVAAGARIAEPGELTRRAVANGKLDLARAEALLGVISAGSARAWRLAQDNLSGRTGEAAAELEGRVLRALAEIEGRIDFPEDDLEALEERALAAELVSIEAACRALAGGFRHAKAVTSGVCVALVGEVNAGKSSLLNALVGKERALVAEAPGTTRDYLEVADVWDGVAVTLIDTAGTRETSDPVEQRGIALGAARVAAADVVLHVRDATMFGGAGSGVGEREAGNGVGERETGNGFGERRTETGDGKRPTEIGDGKRPTEIGDGKRETENGDGKRPTEIGDGKRQAEHGDGKRQPASGREARPESGPGADPRVLDVWSKADLVAGLQAGGVWTSARTGAGLDALKQRVLEVAGVSEREGNEDAFVSTARQHEAAVAAASHVEAAVVAQAGRAPGEIVALELRSATRALAQLRGVEVGDRVLDEVFARFCIGK